MRIDDRDASKTQASRADTARGAGRIDPARRFGEFNAGEPGADQVALGHHEQLLARALEAGAAERQRRIEQLKAAVQSGAYHVDAKELSRAIVAEMLAGGAA